ncbi:hypothetical protein [Neptunomonas antarctica]|uniref:Uncharacterized protein n=1 Tax=Neptunomonas antarctica TaxID=619304 RepID=A0A1N7L0T8_9GAMM|nr:hypothetical protein [Neptunomonas antarctica]SIS67424.1 hypothetical protein SAMN05421760_103128 [Neptunomonas antarctica]
MVNFISIRNVSLTVISMTALILGPVQIDVTNMKVFWQQAHAEEGHSSSHSGGSASGKKGGGHDSIDHDDDSHEGSKGGEKGKKSNRSPSDAVSNDVLKGHGRSGRPVWAGGGIPHVELGRLNVSRAPGFVLDRALAEAQAELTNNPAADVHSPLANLALYRELVKSEDLSEEQLQVAANYLGKAADKNTTISDDTIEALNIILATGYSLSNAQVASLASQADEVRSAILAAHDDGGDSAAHDDGGDAGT